MSREILAPLMIRMKNNRCYRLHNVHDDFRDQLSSKEDSRTFAENRMIYIEPGCSDEEYNTNEAFEAVEEIEHGVFNIKMHVPVAFYGVIIGFKASTKRRLEAQTRTTITIPLKTISNTVPFEGNSPKVTSYISIQGVSKSRLLQAKDRIEALVASARSRIKATHFFGIPMNSAVFQERFKLFQEQITAELPNINADCFQRATHLHLTFGVCVLLDSVERAKAMEILQSCKDLVKDMDTSMPFDVHVRGIDIMNDDPSIARVLYGCVDVQKTCPSFQKFADACVTRFRKTGFLVDISEPRDQVKLHMTLMNIRYSNKQSGDKNVADLNGQNSSPTTKTLQSNHFDAREILKRWSDFDFGCVRCDKMVLCPIGHSKAGESFYKITDAFCF